MTLKAVVIGAGWAGEGHTVALRAAGVDVVALCGRTPDAAHAMAGKLQIDDVRFDWRQALEQLRPDIVSIATPAPPVKPAICTDRPPRETSYTTHGPSSAPASRSPIRRRGGASAPIAATR